MAEVLIDVTRLVDRALRGRLPTGVDRVSLAYLDRFYDRGVATIRFAGRWVELGRENSRRVFDALLAPGESTARMLRWCVGSAYALRWRGMRNTLLFNTGHSGLDAVDYARQVRRHSLKPLFFLHDLIPITHPEYCRPGEADKHRRRIETMLRVARGLVVNSAATCDALERFAADRLLKVPPCAVAPLAPARLPAPAAARPLSQPYFVILGTIEPRKNHLLLLHLWRQMVSELGAQAPRLVVIGQRGWECEQVVDLLERCHALREFVWEEPRCNDGELATWLHHSQALLFPSFVEGFGIPLVEALIGGVPVIASDLPVFQQVAGDIPHYVDPLDGPAWKHLILDYAQPNSAARRAQCWRMDSFRPPTWGEHWRIVEGLLERIDAWSW